MRVGARNILNLGDGIQMDVSRGGRKVIVKLAADDTYTVERVRIIRRTLAVTSEAFVSGVYGHAVGAAVARLGDV